MDLPITELQQGSSLLLTDDEIPYALEILSRHGLDISNFDSIQNILTFPQGYVGYITLPNRLVIINPKHKGITLNHVKRIYYFVYSSDSSDLDDPLYDIEDDNNFDLSRAFLKELRKIILKGLPVEYKTQTSSSPFLRGSVNVVNTAINYNLKKKDVFDCTYDELSHDNPINQVLLLAYKKIQDRYQENNLSKYFHQVSIIRDVPLITLSTNTMYCKKALMMAYMIINELGISDLGNKGIGESLLINFDDLYETFIKIILTKHSEDYKFVYWDDAKTFANFNFKNDIYTKSYLPDLLYNFEESPYERSYCILDMKNKTSKPFSNADIYQMYFYASQLDSKKVILCYPSSINRDISTLKFEKDNLYLKKIFAVFINIAGNTSQEFKRNIKIFIDKVMSLL